MTLTTISLVLTKLTTYPFHIEFDTNSIVSLLLLLTGCGIIGVYTNRTMLLLSVISIELMLFGVNLIFVITSLYLNDIAGEIAATFILTLAGGESALALALIMAYFRAHGNININSEEFQSKSDLDNIDDFEVSFNNTKGFQSSNIYSNTEVKSTNKINNENVVGTNTAQQYTVINKDHNKAHFGVNVILNNNNK